MWSLSFLYISTLFYELPPTLSPLGQLLGVGLFNTRSLMKTAHQISAEPTAIVHSFHWSFVVADLKTNNWQRKREDGWMGAGTSSLTVERRSYVVILCIYGEMSFHTAVFQNPYRRAILVLDLGVESVNWWMCLTSQKLSLETSIMDSS